MERRARAVVAEILNKFPTESDREILRQFTIVAAVVGHFNELNSELVTCLTQLAMLAALRESRENGDDLITADTAGVQSPTTLF